MAAELKIRRQWQLDENFAGFYSVQCHRAIKQETFSYEVSCHYERVT